MVKSITAAPTGIDDCSRYHSGARVVQASIMDCMDFATLFSGLMHSRGVEHLSLYDMIPKYETEANNQMRWYWMMYALFHASATHSIRSLKMFETDIPMQHIQLVEEFIRAPRPLQVIYGSNADSGGGSPLLSMCPPDSFAELASGAPIHLLPISQGSLRHLSAPSSGTPFRVIDSRQDATSIVVPAYGQCWVNTEDIVSVTAEPFETFPEKQWNLKAHNITELMIHLPIDTSEAPGSILPLLKLIGEPLMSLTIAFPGGHELSERDLNDLWVYCPNLISLNLDGVNIPSLDLFVDAYESGKCRVTTLALCPCGLENYGSVGTFTEALGHPSTVIAQTLQHMRLLLLNHEFDEEDENYESPDESLVEGLLSAFKTNDRLSFIDLALDGDVLVNYRDKLREFSGQYLSWVRFPLPLQAKLAFLSTVKQAHTQHGQEALARMDTDVLSRIFSMASTPQRRTITLDGELL